MDLRLKLHRDYIPAIMFAVSASMVVLPLFYIDEGRYSFEGWWRLDNIIGLSVYYLLFIGFQFAMYFTCFSRVQNVVLRSVFASLVFFVAIAFLISAVAI